MTFTEKPWKDPPIFENGKPSISIRAIIHGYALESDMASWEIPNKNGCL